jgi:drug/metabolite transporter (DMT)-like permease
VSLVFLGAWLLGEPITIVQLLGTAVVLGGVLLLTRPAANSVPVAETAHNAPDQDATDNAGSR